MERDQIVELLRQLRLHNEEELDALETEFSSRVNNLEKALIALTSAVRDLQDRERGR